MSRCQLPAKLLQGIIVSVGWPMPLKRIYLSIIRRPAPQQEKDRERERDQSRNEDHQQHYICHHAGPYLSVQASRRATSLQMVEHNREKGVRCVFLLKEKGLKDVAGLSTNEQVSITAWVPTLFPQGVAVCSKQSGGHEPAQVHKNCTILVSVVWLGHPTDLVHGVL